MHLSKIFSSWSGVSATGFSWLYPYIPISWPASATALICSGKVSAEWPGTNRVVLIPKRSNGLSSRILPTSPANRPREMSHGLSSPP